MRENICKASLYKEFLYYHMQNRWPVQVQCMNQGTQSQCSGTTQKDRVGREGGGGSGWEHICIPVDMWHLC